MEKEAVKTKVLFVCNQNKVRSLTAEHLYKARADLDVKSAGTASFAKKQLTEDLIRWAEFIFVFEKEQSRQMEMRFGDLLEEKEIICLGLPDIFDYKSPSLVTKLVAKLDPFLGRPDSTSSNLKRLRQRLKIKQDDKPKDSKSITSKLLSAVGLSSKATAKK